MNRNPASRSARDGWTWISLTTSLMIGMLIGCSGGQTPDSETDAETELERLRALGYIGFTDSKVDPAADSVTLYEQELSAPGFNLISNRDLTSAQLFDMQGRVVREWEDHGRNNWSNAELLSNGDLLVTGSEGEEGNHSNFLLRMSWDGDVVWRSTITAHHDAEMTPDGKIATLTYQFRSIPAVDETHEVKDHKITLLTADGEVLEEHSVYDMLCTDPDRFVCRPGPPKVLATRAFIDLLHANSLEFMRHAHLVDKHEIYAPTNVLLSMRAQDVVAIFDWERKRLVWSWGPGEISAQHDATVLENGNILVFDNGLDRSRSRIVELDPLSKTIVWEYQAQDPGQFFSLRKGASQRLANGNTLIANSDSGEAFEVTREGRMVWRFLNPNADDKGNRATIVRIQRYPESFIHGLMEGRTP